MELCITCDQPIPEKRMQAVPGTRHCVNCAKPGRRQFKELPGTVTVQHTGGLHEKYLKEEDLPFQK